MGIEKVFPRIGDLAVFLHLLPRSSTAERMNPYTSLWTGVREGDGPQRFHLILLDNGRTRVLADRAGRHALRCIRCSACFNVCPVYRQTGGQAYDSVYPGPIGAILTPQLAGRPARPRAAVRLVAVRRLLRGLPGARSTSHRIHLHARGMAEERARSGLEGLSLMTLGEVFGLPHATRGGSGSPLCCRGPSRCRLDPASPPGSLGAAFARSARAPAADLPRVVGVVTRAGEVILGRIRSAFGRRPAVPVVPRARYRLPATPLVAGIDLSSNGGGPTREVASPMIPRGGGARRARPRVPRVWGSRADLDGASAFPTWSSSTTTRSRRPDLDGLDGALTACALAIAETARSSSTAPRVARAGAR